MRLFIRMTILLSAVLSVLTACNVSVVEDVLQTERSTVIHYSATVNEVSATKATFDGSNYVFETGDKLVVTGTNISGELTIRAEDAGKTTGAIFEGDLTYTGAGTPAASQMLNVTLQSTSMASPDVSYSSALAPTLAEAVQKFSNLTATGTYGEKTFSLEQNSSFVEFILTFNDGTTISDGSYTAKISDESTTPYNAAANVQVSGDEAHFFAAFPGGQVLLYPKVTINYKDFPLVLPSITLAANTLYQVTKTRQATIDLSAVTADVSIPANSVVRVTGSGTARTITAGGGSAVTLVDATAQRLVISGNAMLRLEGDNILSLQDGATWSLTTAAGSTVTIRGDGSLTSTRTGWYQNGGCISGGNTDFIIEGGTLNMRAGSGEKKGQSVAVSVRNLTMKGGKITARGGQNDAGTDSNPYTSRWDAINASGDVLIENGTLEADGAHGIRAEGDLTIRGGEVTATGAGTRNNNSGLSAGGTLTISGGTVVATGSGGSPGIGDYGTCGDILINGGTVMAFGGYGSAAIGTGSEESSCCGNITITSHVDVVYVRKGINADYIGRGWSEFSTVGTVTIEDGVNINYISNYNGNGQNITWE